jgi:hypothetical protein
MRWMRRENSILSGKITGGAGVVDALQRATSYPAHADSEYENENGMINRQYHRRGIRVVLTEYIGQAATPVRYPFVGRVKLRVMGNIAYVQATAEANSSGHHVHRRRIVDIQGNAGSAFASDSAGLIVSSANMGHARREASLKVRGDVGDLIVTKANATIGGSVLGQADLIDATVAIGVDARQVHARRSYLTVGRKIKNTNVKEVALQ